MSRAGRNDVLEAKASLRDEVWAAMEHAGVTRFPGARGRIPNFVGAEAAAERLRETPAWQGASTVKANPDSPQWPVRQRALEDGKVVYMAVPRLAAQQPFLRLDPERLRESPRKVSSIKGSSRHGEPVGVEDLEPVDLVVCGCVAVDERGGRLGKGGGYSDLEMAVAAEAGLVSDRTVVASTVHAVQVVGLVPVTDHDFRLDLVVTPDRVIEAPRRGRKSAPRVAWDELSDEKIGEIPLLERLRPR